MIKKYGSHVRACISALLVAFVLHPTGGLSASADVAKLGDVVEKAFCENDSATRCEEARSFVSGNAPVFPRERSVTIGRVYVDGRTEPDGRFVALFVDNKAGGMRLAAQWLRPDDDSERAEIEDYMTSLAAGSTPQTGGLHMFLQQTWARIELVKAIPVEGALLIEQTGVSDTYFRQSGDRIVAVQITRIPKAEGSADRIPAVMMAVFPALSPSRGAAGRSR
jgi:hypothetical protein